MTVGGGGGECRSTTEERRDGTQSPRGEAGFERGKCSGFTETRRKAAGRQTRTRRHVDLVERRCSFPFV